MGAGDHDVTGLLHAVREGDANAQDRLFKAVYSELHRLAAGYLNRERPGHTLQPTALINEAYLRLASADVNWQNRAQFVAIAATTMRRILVDHARRKQAEARGGGRRKVELDDNLVFASDNSADIIAVNDALTELEKETPRRAKVVELRFFAGLEVDEIAKVLGVSPRSVKRDWALARVWLHKRMTGSDE